MVKILLANTGDAKDLALILGLERSPEAGNDTPLQYSCLENSMGRRAWWSTAHGVVKSWTRLSTHRHIFVIITKLTGARQYLMVLIYILQKISDVEHLFMCLLAICISSLEKCLFISSAHFKIKCLFFSCWIIWIIHIFLNINLYWIYDLQIVSPTQ